jgi:hypothetical protein
LFREKPVKKQPEEQAAILEVLSPLWETKLKTIRLLECWIAETPDSEIRAGLAGQMIDERRHLRLLGDQIRRLGGTLIVSPMSGHADGLSRVFNDATTAGTDLHRLFALHRGIKAHTLDRCGQLIPMVDRSLVAVIDRIILDEERHIRWADMRLARLLTRDRMRECHILLDQIQKTLDSFWSNHWRHFSAANHRRSA